MSTKMRLREIIRFGIVGAAQNLLNVGLFALLVGIGVQYLLAAIVAAATALAASFVANRRWTFRDAADRSAHRQATEYVAIFVAASLGALGLLALFTEVAGIPKVIAQAMSLMTMAPLSYLAQRRFTFRRGEGQTGLDVYPAEQWQSRS